MSYIIKGMKVLRDQKKIFYIKPYNKAPSSGTFKHITFYFFYKITKNGTIIFFFTSLNCETT